MDLNIFDVFLPTAIVFIIGAQIVPFLDSPIWLLSHFDTVLVVFVNFFLFWYSQLSSLWWKQQVPQGLPLTKCECSDSLSETWQSENKIIPNISVRIKHAKYLNSPITIFFKLNLKNQHRNFPGGPVVKNPPCNAGDTGRIPSWGTKILHAIQQVKAHCNTAPGPVPQLENLCAAVKDPTCHN